MRIVGSDWHRLTLFSFLCVSLRNHVRQSFLRVAAQWVSGCDGLYLTRRAASIWSMLLLFTEPKKSEGHVWRSWAGFHKRFCLWGANTACTDLFFLTKAEWAFSVKSLGSIPCWQVEWGQACRGRRSRCEIAGFQCVHRFDVQRCYLHSIHRMQPFCVCSFISGNEALLYKQIYTVHKI